MTENRKLPHLVIPESDVHPLDKHSSGFGPGTFHRDDFSKHGRRLLKQTQLVKRVGEKKFKDPVERKKLLFEVEVAPTEKIRQRRSKLKEECGFNLIKINSETSGLALTDIDSFDRFIKRLHTYAYSKNNKGKSHFSFIEKIRPARLKAKVSPDVLEELKSTDFVDVIIQLIHGLSNQEIEAILMAINEVLSEHGGTIDNKTIKSLTGTFIRGSLNLHGLKLLADNFFTLYSFELDSKFFVPQMFEGENIDPEIHIKNLRGNAKVCIFDSGVTPSHPILDPYILDRKIKTPNKLPPSYVHGTFVASRVVFGDDLVDQLSRGILEPKVKVLDVAIFPKDSQTGKEAEISTSDIIDTVNEIVASYHRNIKVYNLSLGSKQPISNSVSRLAKELDSLSKKYKVLFVVAAGNLPPNWSGYQFGYPTYFEHPDTQISAPAEHFCGLSVGSIAKLANSGSMAGYLEPSPFARRGPGYGNIRKPDLVEHGGNIGQQLNLVQALCVSGLHHTQRRLSYAVGTSYSAPIISQYAARLFDEIPDATPNLVKALLIHSATVYENTRFSIEKYLRHVGYGLPNYDVAVSSSHSRVTYIYQGQIPLDTKMRILFRVPEIVTASLHRIKFVLKVTVVYDPFIDPDNSDYSLTHIHANVQKLNEGAFKQMQPKKTVLHCKDDWNPVQRFEYHVSRNFAAGDWALDLSVDSRWDVPNNYLQNFAVVISIEDPHGELDLYSAVLTEVPNRYQIATRKRIRSVS
ncbi:MAG: S8 family peptidase [Thermosipho sp. (in: Bacteria)]|nr:S8 family peptidase [Thermosipho sp. (in: thermotogales)]